MNILRQRICRFQLQLRGKNHISGWNKTPKKRIATARTFSEQIIICDESKKRWSDTINK